MINVTGNFSDDMRKYVVTVPPLLTTVAGVEITLPAVVFEFGTGSSTTLVDVASALQEYADMCSPVHTDRSACLCSWLRRNTNLEEGITSAFERALVAASCTHSVGGHVVYVTGLKLGYKLKNELRLEWARHCTTALLSTPSPRNKEMNDKHNYKPQLVIGDRLVPMPEREPLKQGQTYWFPNLRFPEDGVCINWSNDKADYTWLNNGLVHLTKEAAIAHGEALVALSKKKD